METSMVWNQRKQQNQTITSYIKHLELMAKTKILPEHLQPMTKISIETKRFSSRGKCLILSLSIKQPRLNSLEQMTKKRQKLEINLELQQRLLIHREKHIKRALLHLQANLTKLLRSTLHHRKRILIPKQVHSKLMLKNSLLLKKLKQRVKVANSKEMQLLSWTLSALPQVVDRSILIRMPQLKNSIRLRVNQSLMQNV